MLWESSSSAKRSLELMSETLDYTVVSDMHLKIGCFVFQVKGHHLHALAQFVYLIYIKNFSSVKSLCTLSVTHTLLVFNIYKYIYWILFWAFDLLTTANALQQNVSVMNGEGKKNLLELTCHFFFSYAGDSVSHVLWHTRWVLLSRSQSHGEQE